jgi:hypothetical protein
MATGTGGTNSNASLTSLLVGSAIAAADIATIQNAIYDDRVNVAPNLYTAALNTIPTAAQNPLGGAFSQQGLLYVPNRGILKCLPGDYVMVDTVSGWPILVSRTAIGIAGTVWTS